MVEKMRRRAGDNMHYIRWYLNVGSLIWHNLSICTHTKKKKNQKRKSNVLRRQHSIEFDPKQTYCYTFWNLFCWGLFLRDLTDSFTCCYICKSVVFVQKERERDSQSVGIFATIDQQFRNGSTVNKKSLKKATPVFFWSKWRVCNKPKLNKLFHWVNSGNRLALNELLTIKFVCLIKCSFDVLFYSLIQEDLNVKVR